MFTLHRGGTSRRLATLLVALAAWFAAPEGACARDDRELRNEVRRFERGFARSKTAQERIELVRALPDETGHEDLAEALIEALEANLDHTARVRRELDEVRAKLAPYIKPKLTDAEWKARESLEDEVAEVGARLDAENDVALEIVEKLVAQDGERIVEFLADWALRHRSWRVRAEVIGVLGRWRAPDALDTVVIASRDDDPRVRQVAVEQLARMGGGESVDEYLIERLGDEEWPVRAAAIASLVRRESRDAVGAIILRMAQEDGRLRDDCVRALERLTGQTLGDDPRAWRDWWVENHAEPLEVDRYRRLDKKKGVSFHEVATNSDAIVYVVDISDSMNEAASDTEILEGGVARRDDVDRSKFDVVVKELIRAISSLPEGARFNVIVYNHEVRRWEDEMQPATKRSKNAALEFLLSLEAYGGTNIFDALELAFESAGFGAQDRYYEPALDTIYFLSDGAPSAGRITDPQEILAEVDRMNRFRRITIHAIGVGKLHDRLFMKSLADDHGGEYVERL